MSDSNVAGLMVLSAIVIVVVSTMLFDYLKSKNKK